MKNIIFLSSVRIVNYDAMTRCNKMSVNGSLKLDKEKLCKVSESNITVIIRSAQYIVISDNNY